VHRYDSATRELEVCAAKSLTLNEDGLDPDEWERDDAYTEVAALRRVSGLPGTARYLDIVEEPTGELHIILE
jgi:hypothetical protein